MKNYRCGRSGLVLPAMTLGFWHSFGSNVSYGVQRGIVCEAFEHGIYHFDLANCYGPPDGEAEDVFSRIFHNELRCHRDEILIATKAGAPLGDRPYQSGGSMKHLISSIDKSLKRLGLDYVDIFYHHCPDPDTDLHETAYALSQIVRRGKALYIGVSNYDPTELQRIADILRANNTPCVICQSNYSMLNPHYTASGLMDVVQDNAMGSVAYSVLAQGILTGKYSKGIPSDSRIATDPRYIQSDSITTEMVVKVDMLAKLAIERDQSLAQMALAWAKQTGQFTSVLIGASKPSQVAENVASLKNMEFTTDELARIQQILQL